MTLLCLSFVGADFNCKHAKLGGDLHVAMQINSIRFTLNAAVAHTPLAAVTKAMTGLMYNGPTKL